MGSLQIQIDAAETRVCQQLFGSERSGNRCYCQAGYYRFDGKMRKRFVGTLGFTHGISGFIFISSSRRKC